MTDNPPSVDVLAERVGNLADKVEALTRQLERTTETYVPRTEWALWRENANRELKSVREDVEALEAANDARHISWPSVAGAVAAVAALALSIITRVSP